MQDLTEKTLSVSRVFDGRLVHLEVQEVLLPDGRKGRREIIRHCAAVGILARRPDGKFIFVRQFRKPIETVLLEVIAGCVEEGEDPADCARREVAEETGYEVTVLKKLTTITTSPGCFDEILHIYYAELTEKAHEQHLDQDENVFALELTADEVRKAILDGTIWDAKTICAWAYYEMMQKEA